MGISEAQPVRHHRRAVRPILDSRFPASARTGPVFTRTSCAGMTRGSPMSGNLYLSLVSPLDPPFLLRRIFDLGGLKKESEGHPQTLGSILLHRHCAGLGQPPGPQTPSVPLWERGDSGGFQNWGTPPKPPAGDAAPLSPIPGGILKPRGHPQTPRRD